MENKWAFLQSLRFWSVVVIGLMGYFEAKGYIGDAERNLIWTIAGGFGIIRTVDRNTGDTKVRAAEITAQATVEAAPDTSTLNIR